MNAPLRRIATRLRRTASGALVAQAALACSGHCPTIQKCDIRTPACQEKAAEVASCLRGGSAVSPPVIVVNADQFVKSEVDKATQNPETADERDLRRGLALFDLASPNDDQSDVVREYWSEVAAFFSSETGKVTVLDRGRAMNDASMVELLVHELTHAMQHQSLGRDYFTEHTKTYDDSLALTGMLEGEAVLYQDLATAYAWSRDPDDVDWDGIFGSFESVEWSGARAKAPGVVLASLRFPYAFGGAYLNRAWRAGGNDTVRTAISRPPNSTRQILAGFGAAEPKTSGWREDPNDVGAPVLPSAFESVATRHLGDWVFEVFKDISSTKPRALRDFVDTGFSGDVFSVLRKPATSDVTAIWRLRFGTDAQASDFISHLGDPSPLAVSRDGRDVILVASTDAAAPPEIIVELSWTTAPEDDAGADAAQASLAGRAPDIACRSIQRTERL